MAIAFTPEQQKAIDLRNRNILVSAAAGSGKTAVLTERIVRMVADREHPVDIDRLLVVTFTNAAAAEMRERIRQEVERRLEADPENIHLQKQASLLHNAQITTIDSFCLFLIRNNFNDIGLDPGFRVADEGELKLMRQDVLGQLLEQKYQEGSAAFTDCVEYFTGGSNDSLLEEYINKLYDFSMSYPWPEDWISQCKSDYLIADVTELEESSWCRYLTEYIQIIVEEGKTRLEEALEICNRPDGPYMYGPTLEQDLKMLEGICGRKSLEDYRTAFETVCFKSLSSKKDETVSTDDRELVKEIRNGIKKQIKVVKDTYLILSSAKVVQRMQAASGCVETLLSLVLDYKRMLDERKRAENVIDFQDMEHMALAILLHKQEDGSSVAAPAALEYRHFFEEILIDEYQDSNLVQELLLQSISGEEEGHFNRFMVGDVKQSIYKFRLARPELFMEKYDCYPKEDSDCQRIDLHQNFRSRMQVIDSINALFTKLMGKRLGGVEYDAGAALYPGAEYPEEEEDAYRTEYLLAQKDPGSQLSVREQEALLIAGKIRALYRSLKIMDKETGRLRPARYGDMVILLRTASGWVEEFKAILEREGIPAYVSSRTGYFQTSEVKALLQLLRVLDNPLQDIPLYGTMHSFFGGFSEEEIAQIRAVDKKAPLFELLKEYQGESKEKVQMFLEWISGYRDMTAYTPIHKLIQKILLDTGYLDYVTARPGGSQRRANVEMLLTRAAAFENTSYYGLFHFLRYIEQLEKYEVDYGEADVLDENADVVRIMSIHKSKGLEFPICFVAGLSKRFNMQDAAGRLIADADMGIGVDYVDNELRLQSHTLKKHSVALKMRLDALGEEMRILYVAMTRAKEKLIMTGMVADAEKVRERLEQSDRLEKGKEKIPFSTLAEANCYLDFILPCLKKDQVQVAASEELQMGGLREAVEGLGRERQLFGTAADEELLNDLSERLDRRYPHEELAQLFVKTTVSELKMQAIHHLSEKAESEEGFTRHLFEDAEVVPYIPSFIKSREGLSGTDRGSAYHKVMELLDFKALEEQTDLGREAERQMDAFVSGGRLEQQWRDAVSAQKLLIFLESPLARRMMRADAEGGLYREQPFVLGLSAQLLGEQFPEQEQVLIQGIIDAYFKENNKIILVDYKTDTVSTEEELIRRYRTQLDYYAQALQRLTGMEVAEKILYSFALGKEVCYNELAN